jgi:hypothetical protein
MRELGIHVVVTLKSGERIEGWLRGEDDLGLYVALDVDGKHIRFVPYSVWSGTFFQHDRERAHFVSSDHDKKLQVIEALERETRKPVADALDRIDLNRINRISLASRDLDWKIRRFEHDQFDHGRPERELAGLVAEADRARRGLSAELAKSGLEQLIRVHSSEIRQITSRETIPRLDGVLSHEIDEDITRVRERGYKGIADAPVRISDLAIMESISLARTKTKVAERPEPSGSFATALKWVNVGTMLAGGSVLASGNILVGAIAGATLSAPTLGLGTVAAYLGLLTSVYTGVTKFGEGLKNAGELLEPKTK